MSTGAEHQDARYQPPHEGEQVIVDYTAAATVPIPIQASWRGRYITMQCDSAGAGFGYFIGISTGTVNLAARSVGPAFAPIAGGCGELVPSATRSQWIPEDVRAGSEGYDPSPTHLLVIGRGNGTIRIWRSSP